jgi:hypothetical protein
MLEKLIIACRTPRKEKEWQDDLLPRFIKIPTPELIRLTGFSKQYINYFKNGKRQPGPETIEKLRVVIGEYENLTIVR